MPAETPAADPVLYESTRILVPLLILVGGYLLWVGASMLALQPGANHRELCRRFNISPKTRYKFLGRYREEGEQGLEAGDDPVEAVAQAAGYEDAAVFGRLFRRKVGLRPTQYRRRFAVFARR